MQTSKNQKAKRHNCKITNHANRSPYVFNQKFSFVLNITEILEASKDEQEASLTDSGGH